jgi:hypothetical protein
MKRFPLLFVFAAMLATNAISAMDGDQSANYEAECRKYALEDSVPAEDIDAYVEQCMKDMAESTEVVSDTPPDTVENRE